MKENKIANRISDGLEISRDILAAMPKVVITGNGVITVEGFLGLVEYTEDKTTVKSKSGAVMIVGAELCIDEITEERITLKGKIDTVKFL